MTLPIHNIAIFVKYNSISGNLAYLLFRQKIIANCFASSKIFRKTQFRVEQDFVVALFGEFHELNWIKRNWMFHTI